MSSQSSHHQSAQANQGNQTPFPTPEEQEVFAIQAFKGIEVGLGKKDPLIEIAKKLEKEYPEHLILVQQGKFLHGYDKTAYALYVLKKYKLKLVGTTEDPHLRVGFPAGNYKRRLWTMVSDLGIPYVVLLGNQTAGHQVYVSKQPMFNASTLKAVSDDIVQEVILDLQMRGEVIKAGAQQLLSQSTETTFKLKSVAEELDRHLLRDIAKLPRDHRAVWGETVRDCMARIMRAIFLYGTEERKPVLLKSLSADVDLLKHYLVQAHRLNLCKGIAFGDRVGLAVELGKLVGGLLRQHTQRPASTRALS